MRPVRILTLLFALAHGAVIFALAWSRYATCHNRTFDLALYARTAWGLSHADVWNPIADANFLHLHAAWALWPLGLVGRLFGTVPVLLLAQSLAIAACAWPLARIGERHLGAHGGWIATLVWIAYPNLGHVGSYEMHPGTLALLPLCWALDALDRKDGRALAVCTLGVLLCRADYALITATLGVLLWSSHAPAADNRTPRSHALRWGRVITASSIGYLLLVLGLQHLWPAHGPSSAQLHFGHWGGSPLGVVGALLSQPGRVFDHFMTFERLSYVPRVFLPLAFLPLGSPRWLWVAAPTLALNLISHWPTVTRLDSHYLTPAVAVFVVAALNALGQLRARWPRLGQVWLAIPCAASVVMGGYPWSLDFQREDFVADDQSRACIETLARIAAHASVQAPDPLLPHLAERAIVHRSPPPERGTDYVVFDTTHRQRFAQHEDLLRTLEEPLLRTWLARDDHAVVHAAGPWLLLQRGQAPRTSWSRRYFVDSPEPGLAEINDSQLTACLSVVQATVQASVQASALTLTLRAHGPCPPDLALRIGTEPRPTRVDLLFDGLLSPAQLRAGDTLISTHPLTGTEVATMARAGVWLGALRQSGARPTPDDPIALHISINQAP